ncbi:MAG TPA: GMC family oxidoreductase [Gaiellales bacterium]
MAPIDPSFTRADTVVIGGGTSGPVVAGRLAEGSDERVLVIEAGPDYGARDSGRWPADLLDARALPITHGWGYDSGDLYAGRTIAFERARVIGGCSAHNGCAALYGSRADYDAWAADGCAGWATDDLLPLFDAVSRRLELQPGDPSSVGPFHRAVLDGARAIGLPVVRDLNDLDEDLGAGAFAANIRDGVRWNAAFAYLDPVRAKPNVAVLGDAIVDRIELADGRPARIHAIRHGEALVIEADRVVLSAGTYGTPAILLRSGIGPADALERLGIDVVRDVPGVGGNLHDHPMAELDYAGSDGLGDALAEAAAQGFVPEEQTIVKARSAFCDEAFDLHLAPVAAVLPESLLAGRVLIAVANMTPRSRGRLTLTSRAAEAPPRIDHGYLNDPAGADLAVIVDGIRIARELAASGPLASVIGAETGVLAGREGADLAEGVRQTQVHYYHPVGTARMGRADDRDAVCDENGRVRGLGQLWVADCSLIPTVPRANTNIPAFVVGERVARALLG